MSQFSSPWWHFPPPSSSSPPPQASRRQPVSVWTTSAGSAFSGWASSRAGVPTTPGRASRRPPAGSRSICTGRYSYWTRFCTPCPSPTHSPWIEASSGTRHTRLCLASGCCFSVGCPGHKGAQTAVTLKTTPTKGVFWPYSFFSPLPLVPSNQTTRTTIKRADVSEVNFAPFFRGSLTCAVGRDELQCKKKSYWTTPAARPQNHSPGTASRFVSNWKLTLVHQVWPPFSPGSSSGGQQHLREFHSLLLNLNKVTLVDQPWSGQVLSNWTLCNVDTQRNIETFCPSYTRGVSACRFEWLPSILCISRTLYIYTYTRRQLVQDLKSGFFKVNPCTRSS